jgi:hypothetical protein
MASTYLTKLARGRVDPRLVEPFVKNSPKALDFVLQKTEGARRRHRYEGKDGHGFDGEGHWHRRESHRRAHAVGNNATSVMGAGYAGSGATLGPCITFGYLAGTACARGA